MNGVPCPECTAVFLTEAEMQMHVRWDHRSPKPVGSGPGA